MPHPSTLGKITARCGPEVIEALNRALLVKAAGEKVVKLDKVRADTTVVEANVAYPTDSGLLVRAITLIVALVARIHSAGAASRTTVRDRRRAAGRRARSISAHLKLLNEQAKERVLAITGELADLAEAMIVDATRVLVNARRHLHRQGEGAAGRLQAAVAELDTILDRAGRVIAQTRTRLSGITPASATRLVSLHDPDARPIAKGRLGKPVEFGYKAQFTDNTDGIVLDYSAHEGNPADAPLLAPGIGRIKSLFGTPPGAVTADRGYGEAKVDETLTGLGVNTVVIPRKGKPSAARREVEHGRGFRRRPELGRPLVNFRLPLTWANGNDIHMLGPKTFTRSCRRLSTNLLRRDASTSSASPRIADRRRDGRIRRERIPDRHVGSLPLDPSVPGLAANP